MTTASATLGSSSGRRKKNQLAFPPLTKGWTVKSEASWPGAEYTRRSRLKTKCEEPLGAAFVEELQATLGAHYSTYEQARCSGIAVFRSPIATVERRGTVSDTHGSLRMYTGQGLPSSVRRLWTPK